ncbi:hypothetical protein EHO65_07205 [Leptospira andrefontaineae]|uniref:Uncharacterized protein n=1 Tax=Leptospira andrefontaineae TaxID=2484976 RepID=A0A4R9H6I9_9LEPT|nr:hypothetical protein EHO65_07205 [Leptospira andrefontaineae]
MDQISLLNKIVTWIKGNWKILLFVVALLLSYTSGCMNAALLQSQECKSSGIIRDPIHFTED